MKTKRVILRIILAPLMLIVGPMLMALDWFEGDEDPLDVWRWYFKGHI